jgi:hypothetical protein
VEDDERRRLERLKSKDSVLWWSQKHSAAYYAWQGSHLLYLSASNLAGPLACVNNHYLQHTRTFWLIHPRATIPTKLIYWFPPTGDRLA